MKKHAVTFGFLFAIALAVVFIFSAPAPLAQAQSTYAPLAPIGGVTGEQTTLSSYLPALFQLGIGIASGLAVLAIAYGGIKYMMSDVVTSKSEAIGHIKNALLGLFLAICSYLILFTINPALTNVNFSAPIAQPLASGPFILSWSTKVSYELKWQTYNYVLSYTDPYTAVITVYNTYKNLTDCLAAKTDAVVADNNPTCTRTLDASHDFFYEKEQCSNLLNGTGSGPGPAGLASQDSVTVLIACLPKPDPASAQTKPYSAIDTCQAYANTLNPDSIIKYCVPEGS